MSVLRAICEVLGAVYLALVAGFLGFVIIGYALTVWDRLRGAGPGIGARRLDTASSPAPTGASPATRPNLGWCPICDGPVEDGRCARCDPPLPPALPDLTPEAQLARDAFGPAADAIPDFAAHLARMDEAVRAARARLEHHPAPLPRAGEERAAEQLLAETGLMRETPR